MAPESSRPVDTMVRVAVAATKQRGITDFLEQELGEDGQAWVVCSFLDCVHSIKGHCDIYTVADVPKLKPGEICDRYEKRVLQGPESETAC